MMEVIRLVRSELEQVCDDVSYLHNDGKPNYPYITYSLTFENRDSNKEFQKGAYLDISLYDNEGYNNDRIETVLNKLMSLFSQDFISGEGIIIRPQTFNSNALETASSVLQRREATIYLLIDY